MFKTWALCLAFIVPVLGISQTSSVELLVRPVPKPATLDTASLNWNISQPSYKELNGHAKEVLYWTNFCRNNPQKFWDSVMVPLLEAFPNLKGSESRSLRSDLVKAGKLPMFTLSPVLIRTSQAHSDDISRKQSPPSHTSTNGMDFGARMKQAGIRFCASENMSLGNQDVLLSVALLYLDIGLPELGHRKALLNPNLLEIGVGYAKYGKDQFFVVQDFSCLQTP